MVTIRSAPITALRIVRGVLVVAISSLAAHFIFTMPHVPDLTASVSDPPAATAPYTARHELSWYAPLWERNLNQPPIPPEQVVSRKATIPSGPTPELLATLVEPAGRYAHLRDKNGRSQLRGLGERIDQFQVEAIEPGRVRLHSRHGSVWLAIPKRGRPPS